LKLNAGKDVRDFSVLLKNKYGAGSEIAFNSFSVFYETFPDINILDTLIPEPGSFYVMDCGYLDFLRLHTLH
jgi:hypothetical protein